MNYHFDIFEDGEGANKTSFPKVNEIIQPCFSIKLNYRNDFIQRDIKNYS